MWILFLFSYRKHARSSSSTTEIGNIENEYIRNLQQQIYFLELEANYLYPLYDSDLNLQCGNFHCLNAAERFL